MPSKKKNIKLANKLVGKKLTRAGRAIGAGSKQAVRGLKKKDVDVLVSGLDKAGGGVKMGIKPAVKRGRNLVKKSKNAVRQVKTVFV